MKNLQPQRVFHYFQEINKIPRGSGDMEKISQFCLDFADKQGLKAVRDEACNVIIYKPATAGYEDAPTVILQGHLDMVHQKTEEKEIDFAKDGISMYVDGEYLKADGTTLGGDNGIAVAMIMAILESDSLAHPALEALFTTDEEIGMIGANQVDFSKLKGTRLINLDAEETGIVTVSCAGGIDAKMDIPISRENVSGTRVSIHLQGLRGGHSGIEIHTGRVNANLLAGRIMEEILRKTTASLLSVQGGNKRNVIAFSATLEWIVQDIPAFLHEAKAILANVQKEIADREPSFAPQVQVLEEGTFACMNQESAERVASVLLCIPNGVVEMSVQIPGLVETSLNLGVLETKENQVEMICALRGNKASSLSFLQQRMLVFAKSFGCKGELEGHYPPWEFSKDGTLLQICKNSYRTLVGKEIQVSAIHAGLECAVFAKNIPGIECIALGPALFDVHTAKERLLISSVKETYDLVLHILSNCKE